MSETSPAAVSLQNWIANLDRRIWAGLIGLSLGVLAGILGLMLALLGPVLTLGFAGAVVLGLYALTSANVALFALLAVLIILPFGTLPFRLGLTPTLIDVTLLIFLFVYLIQWTQGKRQRIQLTPMHALIALYLGWLIFSFFMGMRYGSPTATILRQFAGTVLSISLTFILVDWLRDTQTLRRVLLVLMLLIGLQAIIAITLYALPDTITESLLVRLSRIGYPDGGVIRYIESNPELGERAIGTWVDPNALGGIMAIGAAFIAPQVFARQPLLRYRWLAFVLLGLVVLALFLSSSRASFLALGAGLFVIAIARYRRYLPLLFLGGALLFLLPQTQEYVDRVFQALRGEDLATQMRIGEWTDSLELISRYPAFGIGFTGTPVLDVYTDVANMYLIMANQIGLTGLLIFLITMGGVLIYGLQAWRSARQDFSLDSIHLGCQVALMTALINAVADLYFFRLDFQASITWFWLTVTLALASSRMVLQRESSGESMLERKRQMN